MKAKRYGNSEEDKIIGRKIREWYPGAIYHLMERGIRRQAIFQEDIDYQLFLLILENNIKKYDAKIHAYCLMTNHIHLLMETGETEVGKIMQKIAGDYAKTYNKRYGYKGHLFENRYRSCLIKSDEYFLQTSRYIHLNPVKAHMAEYPENYKWSSYNTMIGVRDDKITVKEKTLDYFGGNKVQRYRAFVEDCGHKYAITETEIHRQIEEDEEWLPW